MSKEYDQADLESAAKYFGCQEQLKLEQKQTKLPPLRVDPMQQPLVAKALHGSISFSPDSRDSRGSYAGLLDTSSRKRNNYIGSQDAYRGMMKSRPHPGRG